MKDTTIEIVTERLLLRKFKADDAENVFYNYASSKNVTKYLTWNAHSTIEDTKSYLNDFVIPAYNDEDTFRWAIVLKDTNEVIGCIDVVNINNKSKNVELGWVLGESYWGKGYMPEAARAVIKYLFALGFVRIYAVHHVENKKSGRVMEKVGMTHEGTLRKCAVDNQGNFFDRELYAIVK